MSITGLCKQGSKPISVTKNQSLPLIFGEPGRGRGAVNISWGYEASSYIGANWYIITSRGGRYG